MDRFPRSDSIVQARSGLQTYMAQVYGWMTVGLLLTAFIAWYAANTPAVMMFVFSSKITFFGLIIAQLALVFVLSGLVHKLSAGMATTLFMLYSAVTYIGVVVFVGLTAYDTQKLKNIGEQIDTRDSANLRKYSILGALTLYLDFINLFLMLLRIFGNRR
ncbi:hypothetical protein EQJ46_16050 [Salmonella enterica]|nr:hypothetical protein [Salmonella enterica]EAU2098907.1 hypothetical protein [Salmonella enterica]EKI5601993.1 Bax inhibitor-1 family protein [Salmonella enterica]